MRLARQVFWAPLCFGLFLTLPTPPVFAQDVFVIPKQDKDKPVDDKKAPSATEKNKPDDNSSWFNMFTSPKTPEAKPAPKGNKQQSARQNKPDTNPYVATQPKGGKDNKKIEIPPLPKEVQETSTQLQNSINGVLEAMQNQPTLVIEQPDFLVPKDKDDRVFEHPVTVSVETLELSVADVKNAAKGTKYNEKSILDNCEPRFTGTIIGKEGGELVDIRGLKGKSNSGYKGQSIQSVNMVLALACKLDDVPKNKGVITKFGEYYMLGIAQGVCPAPESGTNVTTIGVSYTGKGMISCKYN